MVIKKREEVPRIRKTMAHQLRCLAHRLDPVGRKHIEKEKTHEQIMIRLQASLREEKLFLDPSLSPETLASHIGTNRTYLIRTLKSRGESFSGYLNGLRLYHVTLLMRQNPSMDLSEIAERSGFSNQRSLNYLIVKRYGFTLVSLRRKISQLLSMLPAGQILQPCHKDE